MRGLRFSVLGPMLGRYGDTALTLGSRQQQATLAVLLLRSGRTVAAADLVDVQGLLLGPVRPRPQSRG
ncbi:hypothetical protein FGW37_28770 [Streptomyces rectiverticillatus]|uniref:hypothetical protein n=1 Tax=Streptomyces rectiverticillatus TaxID=173860 RepID=UPI0015C323E5|nr:hypothetical protein [Streptomyces rectiverticillatus]QLE75063.1 hypothetical protein FGW37_28770 [Streptomyces rectiverticillatus]